MPIVVVDEIPDKEMQDQVRFVPWVVRVEACDVAGAEPVSTLD